jgi:hypothetical protein
MSTDTREKLAPQPALSPVHVAQQLVVMAETLIVIRNAVRHSRLAGSAQEHSWLAQDIDNVSRQAAFLSDEISSRLAEKKFGGRR